MSRAQPRRSLTSHPAVSAGCRAGSHQRGRDTAALNVDLQARGSRGVHAAVHSLNRSLPTRPLGWDCHRCPPRLRPRLHSPHLCRAPVLQTRIQGRSGGPAQAAEERNGREVCQAPGGWACLRLTHPGGSAGAQAPLTSRPRAPGTREQLWPRGAGRPSRGGFSTHARGGRGPPSRALTGLSFLPTKRWPCSVPTGKS